MKSMVVWPPPNNQPTLHHDEVVDPVGRFCFSSSAAKAYTFPEDESAYTRDSVNCNFTMSYPNVT